MRKEDRVKAVSEFLSWLEENTCYEVGEEVYSDYGDGESYFYRISNDTLLTGFEHWVAALQEDTSYD